MAILVLCLVAPTTAGAATEGPPDGPYPTVGSAFAFEIKASNGYELLGLPLIGYGGKQGLLQLVVRKPSAAVVYAVPATVTAEMPTATTIEADLGELGRISLKLVPTGRKKTVRTGCEGRAHSRVEAARYEGTIEFHGEEGFTDVSATSAPVNYDIYRRILCYELEFTSGTGRPAGALIELTKRSGEELELALVSAKRHPAGRTSIYASARERRGEIAIEREVAVVGGPGALRYAPDLRTATLRPPAPFAGHATFRRGARPANRWTGNLTADFPGRSGVALTGPGLRVDLSRPGP